MQDHVKGRRMKTVVQDKIAEYKRVTSGMTQGSALALIMFLVYVNDE